MKYCLLDIECSKTLYEVNYEYDKLDAVSIIVYYYDNDIVTHKTYNKTNESLSNLYNTLLEQDKIITFNGNQFDLLILSKWMSMYYENASDIEILFGKHKGSKLKDVPRDYIEWMKKNNIYSKEIKSYETPLTKEDKIKYNIKSDMDCFSTIIDRSFDIFHFIKEYTKLEYPVSLRQSYEYTINKSIPEEYKDKSLKDFLYDDTSILFKYCIFEMNMLVDLFDFIKKYDYILIPQIKNMELYKDLTIKIPIKF